MLGRFSGDGGIPAVCTRCERCSRRKVRQMSWLVGEELQWYDNIGWERSTRQGLSGPIVMFHCESDSEKCFLLVTMIPEERYRRFMR